MPHAIILQGVAPSFLCEEFTPWKETVADGSKVEARSAFLRHDLRVLLIQTVAIELGPAQHFFVAIEEKRQQLSVRLYPHPTPTRTPAVQWGVARVAKWVLQFGGSVDKTNLDLG